MTIDPTMIGEPWRQADLNRVQQRVTIALISSVTPAASGIHVVLKDSSEFLYEEREGWLVRHED